MAGADWNFRLVCRFDVHRICGCSLVSYDSLAESLQPAIAANRDDAGCGGAGLGRLYAQEIIAGSALMEFRRNRPVRSNRERRIDHRNTAVPGRGKKAESGSLRLSC